MSSLRNAVKRITHKERPTPRGTAFLERKKDYVVRARDYHHKQDRLNTMRERASLRNPDEFYFGMKNSEMKEGKHRKTRQYEQQQFEQEVGMDTVRIMKDQDLSYVRTQKQMDTKKAEKLKSSLHFLGMTPQNRKHTIYVQSQEEADQFDPAQHFRTVPELVDRAHNRLPVEKIQKMIMTNSTEKKQTKEEAYQEVKLERRNAKKLAKRKDAAYREMQQREKRAAAMKRAEAHLVTEKLVASKGRKRKIKASENGQPAQYKWRRKRLG